MRLLSSSVFLVHSLTADAQGVGDRDPREAEGARAAHLLGFGAREVGVQRAQPAEFGEGVAAVGRGDRGADLIAHAVNRS